MALEQISLLGSPFLTNIVLPFVLVFTVVFAILEKTELLGKARKDINAIVSLVIALLATGVPAAIGVLQNLIPVIAILIVILFGWFLVFGFVGTQMEDKKLWTSTLQRLFSIVLGVILLGIVTWAVGVFDYVTVDPATAARVGQFVLLLGAIIAVVAIVVASSPATTGGKNE